MSYTLNIISILSLCITRVSALDTFPDKFILGEKGVSVTLHCDTAIKQPVIWKQDNMLLPESDGMELTLHDFEEDLTGNYTCWNNDEILDYTYVLFDKSQDISGSFITCTAETFNCSYSISCRMNIPGFRAFRLRNERDNNSWVQPSNDVFSLMHSTNPYAEEDTRLKVVGEAVSASEYFIRTNHSFYLRDIIKPGCPKLSVKHGVAVLDPPSTWASPPSYYPLENEIQCQQRSNGEKKTCNMVNGTPANWSVPEDVSKLRVRCRDPLLLSQWSDWTAWQNVRKRRQNKNKNITQRKKAKNGKNRSPKRKQNHV